MLPAAFRDALAAGFPADFCSEDAGDLAEYGRDWTKVYAPAPTAVLFPRTTDEVARLMALASAHRVPVRPPDGTTGTRCALARMRRMDPVDEAGATVRVQAGAVTAA